MSTKTAAPIIIGATGSPRKSPKLIQVPARISTSARKNVLHLPSNWLWEAGWQARSSDHPAERRNRANPLTKVDRWIQIYTRAVGEGAEAQLASFIGKFAPPVQQQIRGCRAALRERLPAAIELVYDNYNFFVIGFGPTTKPSEAWFSLTADRNGTSLVFLQRGPELPDPHGLLRGEGKKVRNVPLAGPETLARPEVEALVQAELGLASIPLTDAVGPALVIKSISGKQRPRQ